MLVKHLKKPVCIIKQLKLYVVGTLVQLPEAILIRPSRDHCLGNYKRKRRSTHLHQLSNGE